MLMMTLTVMLMLMLMLTMTMAMMLTLMLTLMMTLMLTMMLALMLMLMLTMMLTMTLMLMLMGLRRAPVVLATGPSQHHCSATLVSMPLAIRLSVRVRLPYYWS
jgi:hypothetical protein